MVRIRAVIVLIAQLALLTVVLAAVAAVGPGVGPGAALVGWLVGAAVIISVDLLLVRALLNSGVTALGLPNQVTLLRATLVAGVAALVARSFIATTPAELTAALSTLALALDALDGWLARHTGTVTPLGARFDMEVDAFLILVLSVQVAAAVGPWVLLIGAARYAFAVASWLLRWLREPTPPSYRYKVVAAIQGSTLTVAVTTVMTGRAREFLLLTALVLLAESFRHQIWWLWRYRTEPRGRIDSLAIESVPAMMVAAG